MAPRSIAWFNHALEAPLTAAAHDAARSVLEESAAGPLAPARRAEVLESAREAVAALLGGRPEDLVLTSGGTEAANLAVKGVAAASTGPRRVVLSAVEHLMVLHPARSLERDGFDLRLVAVDATGRVDAGAFEAALAEGAALASLQRANHEIGTLQPVEEVARRTRRLGVPLHVDASAAAGLVPLAVERLGADLVSVSAPRLGGLAGAGALWVREGIRLWPLIEGGTQEGGLRAGAEGLPALAAFGAAAREAAGREQERAAHARRLRDRLAQGLAERIDGMRVHGGPPESSLPGHLHVSFRGVEGEALLLRLARSGIEASSGSPCAREVGKPSHVLEAMGLDPAAARSSVLFSLGPGSREEEVERGLAVVPEAVQALRAIAGELA